MVDFRRVRWGSNRKWSEIFLLHFNDISAEGGSEHHMDDTDDDTEGSGEAEQPLTEFTDTSFFEEQQYEFDEFENDSDINDSERYYLTSYPPSFLFRYLDRHVKSLVYLPI